jgi:hypothetical protein
MQNIYGNSFVLETTKLLTMTGYLRFSKSEGPNVLGLRALIWKMAFKQLPRNCLEEGHKSFACLSVHLTEQFYVIKLASCASPHWRIKQDIPEVHGCLLGHPHSINMQNVPPRPGQNKAVRLPQ